MLHRLWHNHSLSITLLTIGIVLIAISWPLEKGREFDIISMIGGTFLTGAIINLLSGPLVERNMPDHLK